MGDEAGEAGVREMAVVTGVLDVMCAMGVVGVALVTGMADVAHAGNRDGLRRRGRPGSPAYARERTATAGPDRPPREPAGHPGPEQGVCTQAPAKGDGA
ncbi:hypothetical protein [Streptomyces sp. NPDC059008]|uniref:hypothetical protein n=1 Tax=Streptomyces sp. NPDC059008 TaxID=3346693 RepID=UPI0036C8C394